MDKSNTSNIMKQNKKKFGAIWALAHDRSLCIDEIFSRLGHSQTHTLPLAAEIAEERMYWAIASLMTKDGRVDV